MYGNIDSKGFSESTYIPLYMSRKKARFGGKYRQLCLAYILT